MREGRPHRVALLGGQRQFVGRLRVCGGAGPQAGTSGARVRVDLAQAPAAPATRQLADPFGELGLELGRRGAVDEVALARELAGGDKFVDELRRRAVSPEQPARTGHQFCDRETGVAVSLRLRQQVDQGGARSPRRLAVAA